MINPKYKQLYLKKELKSIKRKIRILDIVEEKLQSMKKIALYVRDNELESVEKEKLNSKFQELKRDIKDLDKYGRNGSYNINKNYEKKINNSYKYLNYNIS